MAAVGETRQADDGPARTVIPMRRVEARERRHEVDAAVVRHRLRERLDVGALLNQPEVVAHPLHERTGHRHAPLERVMRRRASDPVRDRRQQTTRGTHGRLAGVQQQEAAGAVGVLRLAGTEAGLTDQRGLLISQDAGDRNTFERFAVNARVLFAAGPDGRQHRVWNVEGGEQLGIPLERIEVHQLRAARVGDVSEMLAAIGAAGQLPHQEGVDSAKEHVAASGALACAGNVIEQPSNLEAREVTGERKAGARPEEFRARLCGESRDVIGDARILPDDGVAQRDARASVPEHRRLALVRDADRRQIRRRQAGASQRGGHHHLRVAPDLEGIVLDPPGPRVDLFVLDLRFRRRARGVVEDNEAGAARALVNRSKVGRHELSRD